MKSKLSKLLLVITFTLSLAAVSNAQAWHHGYWHHGWYGHGYYYRPYVHNCRWRGGYYAHGYWHQAHRVCW